MNIQPNLNSKCATSAFELTFIFCVELFVGIEMLNLICVEFL